MAQIYTPGRKGNNDFSQIASVAGGVVGGFLGGPGGAAAGIGVGKAAGGMLDQKGTEPTMSGDESNPMQRRIESDQRLQDLSQARVAIADLPKDQQVQYAPAIDQAYMLERQRRGQV